MAEAAEALDVKPGMIAKTMSFLQGEKAVLILTEGTAKVDNHKYKDTFHVKAKMIPFDQVEARIERAAGAKGWVDVTSRSTQTRSPQN